MQLTETRKEGVMTKGQTRKRLIDTGPSEAGWHHFELAARCPRLYAWQASGAISGETAEALDFGSLFHIAMAHIYGTEIAENRDLYSPFEAIEVASSKYPLGDTGKVTAAVCAYQSYYGREKPTTIAVEEPLEMAFGSIRYTARVDRIIHTDKVYFWDHKTTGKYRDDLVERYTLSGQMLGLQWLGKEYFGKDFGGVVLNFVQTDGLVFKRVPLPPAPIALKNFPESIINANRIIQLMETEFKGERLIDSPEKCPGAHSERVCTGPYRKCAAFELCRWGSNHSSVMQLTETDEKKGGKRWRRLRTRR